MSILKSVRFALVFLVALIAIQTYASPSTDEGAGGTQLGSVPAKRIIGGEAVKPNSLPYQLLLIIKDRATNDLSVCGGVLIAKNAALTAAHCTHGKSLETHKIYLYSGKHKLKEREATQQSALAKEIHQHKGYKPGKGVNDISLLRIDPPFRLDNATKPIELPSTNFKIDVSSGEEEAWVSGWGCTYENCNGAVSLELKKVQVPLQDNDKCKEAYGDQIIDSMLCAAPAEGGKDACQGDSGGPLVYLDADHDFKPILIGIVSWGEGCAQEGKPGVYTRVTSYLNWIKGQMSKTDDSNEVNEVETQHQPDKSSYGHTLAAHRCMLALFVQLFHVIMHATPDGVIRPY
jgi:coagulation factor 9 (Christmas factor)